MSLFVSTVNEKDVCDSRQAMVRGLSRDGGLYAFENVPKLEYKQLKGLSYTQIAQKIVGLCFDDMDAEDVNSACADAYLNHFETSEVAPVVKAGDAYIVELFHGETCAFKDVALSLLPRLLTKARRSLGIDDKIMILTATSGDTGSAAMNGFRNVANTGIISFFPYGGVSTLQRRQMVCMDGSNVNACAVRGNFDDCQSAVKRAFASLPKTEGVAFSSANSINIARLVPQISYYFTTYLALLDRGEISEGEKLNFVVPTGNFGDILAGYYAKRMGLPINKLVCASNANDVLTEFLTTGVYRRKRPFIKTSSPSMDILISSNLERLLFHAQKGDCELVARQMKQLKTEGEYSVDKAVLNTLREDFDAYSFDDSATIRTIGEFFAQNKYLADPHTAVAIAAQRAYFDKHPNEKCAVLSTASPFKFVTSIADALQMKQSDNVFDTAKQISLATGIKAPEYLMELETKAELHTDVIDADKIADYALEQLEKLL